MAYLTTKATLLVILIVGVFSQIPSSDTFSKYQQQSCCPTGYNSAGVFCVKCNEPKHWDAVSQKCVTCEPGHSWDNVTQTCSCCELPRSIING